MRTLGFAIFFVLAASLTGASEQPCAGEQVGNVVIDAKDLNTRYEIRGPLGVRLGKVVMITAKRVDSRAKADADVLEVAAVNGTPLKSPVTLPYQTLPWSPVELDMNGQYELRVYQDGGFSGIPDEAMKETGPVQTRKYGFAVHLVVLRSVKRSVPVQHSDGR